MTTKTKTRLTAALVARHLAVAIVQKEIPEPALQVAVDLLSDIDNRRRVKDLAGRCHLLIDSGLKAAALEVAAADGSMKDTRRAVQSIRAVAQLSDQLFGTPTEAEPSADSKPETGPNDGTEPTADSDTEIEPERST
ncbi:hypothetical protein [Mycobacteroides abscessus]|uniref:hypothetical protein n=1 Tax=Mycobacteroides abscessus TaxID=36809 RepID=UPI000C26A356|nr:hypothetical protein [Mycobacteroides abscessus]MBE5460998.1 hypothetical protein [Mycobacteroides abscessus]QOF41775.1 hypothetical protein E3G69_000797 [Mycobacteroides abscessus]QOF46471.1 hypothetical protein E3G70_000793 [Mycobacteroides abscessus]